MAEDFLGDRFHGDPIPHTQEELEQAYGGKEKYKKLQDDLDRYLAGDDEDEPEDDTPEDDGEDETVETEDKFLPRRK